MPRYIVRFGLYGGVWDAGCVASPEEACRALEERLGQPPRRYEPEASTANDQAFNVFAVPAALIPAFADSQDEAVLQVIERLEPVSRLVPVSVDHAAKLRAAPAAVSSASGPQNAALLVA
jgi:hypothetical protein